MRPIGVVLAVLAGCTSPSGPDPSEDSTATDTSTTTIPSTTLPEYSGVVEGIVTDDQDAPIPGLQVTLCGGVCRVTTVGPDGSFRFDGVWPQVNVLESVDYPGDDQTVAILEWSRFYELVELADGEHLVLDRPMRVHPVSTARDLAGPQDLELAPGLRVAFDADRVGVDHPLPVPADQVALGATELPGQDWPRATGDWTPHKAWALAIWDLEIDDGFSVTATLDTPIPAGSEVALLVADYLTGFAEGTLEVEPATLSADGLTVTAPAVDRTTLWMVASRTP